MSNQRTLPDICRTCGEIFNSYIEYHKHNIGCHTLTQLSLTILHLIGCSEIVPYYNYRKSPLKEIKQKSSRPNEKPSWKMGHKKSTGTFRTECMDEVIEVGPIDEDDNLTIQSLFLKSNATPFARQVIEVEESRVNMNLTKNEKALSAVLVHFAIDGTIKIYSDTSKSKFPSSLFDTGPSKVNSNLIIESDKRDHIKDRAKSRSHRKNAKKYTAVDRLNCIKVKSSSDSVSNTIADQPVKVVLRSGRAIKSKKKDTNFIYFSDKKNKKIKGTRKKSLREDSPPVSMTGFDPILCDQQFPKLTDFLSSNIDLPNLDLSNELDMSIENLDLEAFWDIDSTLPENQILTVENLLEELEGGGSIEISNIIKENNTESETIIVNDLAKYGKLNDNGSKFFTQTIEDIYEQSEITPGSSVSKNLSDDLMKNGHLKSFKCKLCQKNYSSKINLLYHLRRYHQDKKWMRYKCGSCNVNFGFLAALQRHMMEHDSNQLFVCEVCGKQFRKLQNLKVHFSGHVQSDGFQCTLCPRKYFLKHSLTKHMKTHLEISSYQCNICDKLFKNKYRYKLHLENHENGKSLGLSKDLKCNFCGKLRSPEIVPLSSNQLDVCPCGKGIFKHFSLQKSNSPLKTNNPKADNSNRPRHKCGQCGKFVLDLSKHKREQHRSGLHVTCQICGAFLKKACLSAHMHRKHYGASVKCDHCDKIFKHVLAFREHLNRVKRNENG